GRLVCDRVLVMTLVPVPRSPPRLRSSSVIRSAEPDRVRPGKDPAQKSIGGDVVTAYGNSRLVHHSSGANAPIIETPSGGEQVADGQLYTGSHGSTPPNGKVPT